MQTTKESLTKYLGIMGSIVKPNPAIAITENIIISSENFMRGTDLGFTIEVENVFSGMFLDDFKDCCVNLADLRKAIASAPKNGEINLESDDSTLRIKFGRSVVELPTVDPADFITKPEEGELISTLEKTTFEDMVRCVTPFALKDDLRPVLEGVFFDGKTFVATDAHGLATFVVSSTSNEHEIILPPLALNLVVHGNGEDVSIHQNYLQCGNVKVYYTPIDGKFPNYEAVIPQSHKVYAKVRAYDILEGCKVASSAAAKEAQLGKFTFTSDELQITGEDVDFHKRAVTKVECQSNEPLTIGFNVKFMEQIASLTDQTEMEFKMTEPNRAMVTEHENGIFLLMPVMVV